MSVLLPTDDIGVWDPEVVDDAHGWAEETTPTRVWFGLGSVQEAQPVASDQANEEGGGQGPLDPAHLRTAAVYLPVAAVVNPGDLLEARGTWWVAQRVRFIADPAGLGLDCQVVDAIERVVTP